MMPRPSGAVCIRSVDRQRRLAEEFGAALVLEHQELTLHGADRGHRHIAVAGADLFRVLGQIGQQLAQILEIDQPAAVGRLQFRIVVGETEGDVDDALLHVVEAEHPRDQKRPHLEHRGADRMALFAEQVPEHDRELVGLVVKAHILGAFDKIRLRLAARGDAGEVAFDVGGEHRNAGARKAFREHLQRHGLAGAGRAGGEAVTVGERERQIFVARTLADENFAVSIRIRHHSLPSPAKCSIDRGRAACA